MGILEGRGTKGAIEEVRQNFFAVYSVSTFLFSTVYKVDYKHYVLVHLSRRRVVCRQLLTFSTSSLKPLNGIQVARSQISLPSLCFFGRSENKMAAQASDWLRLFRLLL